MSPLIYIARPGRRPFTEDGEPGEEITAFRAHLRSERPAAWRAIGAGLHSTTVGAFRALTTPPVSRLELLAASDGGWTPPADDSETTSWTT